MAQRNIGYFFIFIALCVAFFGGKEYGRLDCIDFNIMPVFLIGFTLIICVMLAMIGIYLIKLKK